MEASERSCARPPTPQVAWVHQIHAAGGAIGSTTMVMVFVMLFVLVVWFLTHDSLVLLVVHTFRGVTKWPTQACTIPSINRCFRKNLFCHRPPAPATVLWGIDSRRYLCLWLHLLLLIFVALMVSLTMSSGVSFTQQVIVMDFENSNGINRAKLSTINC